MNHELRNKPRNDQFPVRVIESLRIFMTDVKSPLTGNDSAGGSILWEAFRKSGTRAIHKSPKLYWFSFVCIDVLGFYRCLEIFAMWRPLKILREIYRYVSCNRVINIYRRPG